MKKCRAGTAKRDCPVIIGAIEKNNEPAPLAVVDPCDSDAPGNRPGVRTIKQFE